VTTIPVNATGENNWKVFSKKIKNVTGHHDVFIKFPTGTNQEIFIKNIRFVKTK
jgi:xylan 1,4-beta-xylosidase